MCPMKLSHLLRSRVGRKYTKICPYKRSKPKAQSISVKWRKYMHLLKMSKARKTVTECMNERTIKFLKRIYPEEFIEQIISGNLTLPKYHRSITVLFADIVGFTRISSLSTSEQTLRMLSALYSQLDREIGRFKARKIDAIGDEYMAASGFSEDQSDHPCEMVRFAMAIVKVLKNFKIDHLPEERLQMRIGIHTGSVTAGIIGDRMPKYTLIGDTVNTANRIQSTGQAQKIHVSATTASLVTAQFLLDECGETSLKGRGPMHTYFVKQHHSI